jgi:hypothetical protein
VKRHLGYLAVAALALAVAIWIVVDDDGAEIMTVDGPPLGLYRIAEARLGPPGAAVERPELVGRAFIVRRDGPELVAGLCPDVGLCRRWLAEAAPFRHGLPSLPVETTLADTDPEAVLSSAHVVGTTVSAITTTADGRCRRRVDSGSLEATEIGLRLHRELAQTDLVDDCEARPATDHIVIELGLVRLDVQ